MENTIVFALSSSKELASEICQELGLPLGKIELNHFADKEILVTPKESVRGKHVYLVQSTNDPVNDNLMELLIAIDACKRASAQTINAIIPYYGYARQDRKAAPRQPITAKLVSSLLERAGADRVVTIDLHARQIQGFFDIPVDHLMGAPLIADYFDRAGLTGNDVVVVSPDHGGMTRARNLNNMLELESPVAVIDKRRPKPNVAEIGSIVGDVAGKTAIMIDDMIDTAGTITQGAQLIMEHGAKEVYVVASHAVFSGPAVERLQNSVFKKVILTDSINLPENKKFDKNAAVICSGILYPWICTDPHRASVV